MATATDTPESPPETLRWDDRAWGMLFLLALVVEAAFVPILSNGFVNWDDLDNFPGNPAYQGLGWRQVRWAWSTTHMGVYQPLAWMLLEAQFAVWGLDPWGYHATSLALHVLNAAVLYLLTITLIGRCVPGASRAEQWSIRACAFLAAALFAVHPLRVEVVAWASCQPYLPCALFAMVAVLCYVRAHPDGRPRRVGWLVASLAAFTAALLCKAVAISLPAVLLILDGYPLRRLGGGPGRWFGPAARGVWLEKLPFAGMGLVFAGIAINARDFGRSSATSPHLGLSQWIAQACYGACFYAAKTLAPFGLTTYYPMPDRAGPFASLFLLSLLVVAGVSLGVAGLARRWPGLLGAWLIYLALLAPALGNLQIGDVIAADRYSYLASLGWAVLAGHGLFRLGQSRRPGRPLIAAVALGAVAALTVLSWRQCRTWHDSETLWRHALAYGAGRGPVPYNQLGLELSRRGRPDEAIANFSRARVLLESSLRDHPDDLRKRSLLGGVLNGIGMAQADQGRHREALATFRRAIGHQGIAFARAPRVGQYRLFLSNHYLNLSRTLRDLGRTSEAEAAALERRRLWVDARDPAPALPVE